MMLTRCVHTKMLEGASYIRVIKKVVGVGSILMVVSWRYKQE